MGIVCLVLFVWSFLWGMQSEAAPKELFDSTIQQQVTQKLSDPSVQEVLKSTEKSTNQIHFFWTSGFKHRLIDTLTVNTTPTDRLK